MYRRVLLADRHLNLLEGVHGLLETLFDTVVMVSDERSLLAAAATFNPELVVVDLSLPTAQGVNVVRQLLGSFPAMRIVVLSVYDEPALANQLRQAGVSGIVLKRTVATDLVPAVHEVLRGGVYVSAATQPERNVEARCPIEKLSNGNPTHAR